MATAVDERAIEAMRHYIDHHLGFGLPSEEHYATRAMEDRAMPHLAAIIKQADFHELFELALVAPRPVRTEHPQRLLGAARSSDEPAIELDPVTIIDRIKGLPRLMQVLDLTRINKGHGPEREPGHYALLYTEMVASGEVRWDAWHKRMQMDPRLWKVCRFDRCPSYPVMAERFAELEQFGELILQAGQQVIKMCRRKMEHIGAYATIDGTEVQTHGVSRHACTLGDDCPDRRGNRIYNPKCVSVDVATELRQLEAEVEFAEEPLDEDEDAAPVPTTPGLTPIPKNGTIEVTPDGIRIARGGHWWFSRDLDAGTRRYANGKVWHGYNAIKIVDIATGAVLAIVVVSASVNEHHAIEEAYRQLVASTGIHPIALGADRGYATDAVYKFLACNDTGAVMPYRKRHKTSPPEAVETEIVDQHGVPKCRSCGLSLDITKTSGAHGQPRTWGRCPMPSTKECLGEQSVSSSNDWRALPMVPRTSEIYSAVMGQIQPAERSHEQLRACFGAGGKTLRERIRRIGRPAQQLRANAALLVQWMIVIARQGWLDDRGERVQPTPVPVGRYFKKVMGIRRTGSLFGGSARARGAPPPERVAA